MSFFPVPIVRPRLYTRHILELWEYHWNGGRQTYERVCYTPIQVTQPENNPIGSIEGMNLYPSQRIEDLEVQEWRASRPTRLDVRPEATPRPPPPNFGRREDLIPGDSGRPIVVDSTSPVNSPAETNHIFVTEPPTSPDPSPPCSPVNTPSSSPPVSRRESPVYNPLQDHQYALPLPPRSTSRSHHHQRPDQKRRTPSLQDFTEKNPCAAWMESDKKRESWSIYIEPNEATDAKFCELKELLTEHCKKFCLVRNGKTKNMSGEIQLKKALKYDELSDLLGPNIYVNGGPKEEATEKWSMAAKFNEKDYFSIFFTKEPKKNCQFQK